MEHHSSAKPHDLPIPPEEGVEQNIVFHFRMAPGDRRRNPGKGDIRRHCDPGDQTWPKEVVTHSALET